jgi:hypothetical protein
MAATSACPALLCIFFRLPRCEYSYMLRMSKATMLSSSTGRDRWKGMRALAGGDPLRAFGGSTDDSGSSSSISMLSMALCARYWAYLRRKRTDSLLVGLGSLAQGMRAMTAETARPMGVEDSKPVSKPSVLVWRRGIDWSTGT